MLIAARAGIGSLSTGRRKPKSAIVPSMMLRPKLLARKAAHQITADMAALTAEIKPTMPTMSAACQDNEGGTADG